MKLFPWTSGVSATASAARFEGDLAERSTAAVGRSTKRTSPPSDEKRRERRLAVKPLLTRTPCRGGVVAECACGWTRRCVTIEALLCRRELSHGRSGSYMPR